jgi:hypothetical protein
MGAPEDSSSAYILQFKVPKVKTVPINHKASLTVLNNKTKIKIALHLVKDGPQGGSETGPSGKVPQIKRHSSHQYHGVSEACTSIWGCIIQAALKGGAKNAYTHMTYRRLLKPHSRYDNK